MNKGFTLIELLVVVLIIGILSAVALPQYTKAVEKSRATEAMTLLGNLTTAEQIYKMSTGAFTTDMTLLDLQLPGVSGSNPVSTITTKNYKVTAAVNGTTFTGTAQRWVNGKAGEGDFAYTLTVAIDANDKITRTCSGTAASTCKSIANGATCTGGTNDKNWCYKAS